MKLGSYPKMNGGLKNEGFTKFLFQTDILVLLYDEYYSTEGYKNVDDIKQDDGFLEEHPGKDDDPDGGGGTDHVGVSHGHVLQTVEVDDEVARSKHRS